MKLTTYAIDFNKVSPHLSVCVETVDDIDANDLAKSFSLVHQVRLVEIADKDTIVGFYKDGDELTIADGLARRTILTEMDMSTDINIVDSE